MQVFGSIFLICIFEQRQQDVPSIMSYIQNLCIFMVGVSNLSLSFPLSYDIQLGTSLQNFGMVLKLQEWKQSEKLNESYKKKKNTQLQQKTQEGSWIPKHTS